MAIFPVHNAPVQSLPLRFAGDPSVPFNSILGAAYNFESNTGFIEYTPGNVARDCVVGYRSGNNAHTMAGLFSHLIDFQHYGIYLEANGANYNLRPVVHNVLVANAGIVRPQDTLRIECFAAVKPPEIYLGNRLAYAFGPADGGHAFNAACPFGFHGQPYQPDVSINMINNAPNASTLVLSRLSNPGATVIVDEGYTNSVTPSGTIAAASPQVAGVAFPVTFAFVITGTLPYDHVDLYVDGALFTTLFLGLDAAGVSGLTSPQVVNITIPTPGLHYLVARYYNAALKWKQTAGITVQVN